MYTPLPYLQSILVLHLSYHFVAECNNPRLYLYKCFYYYLYHYLYHYPYLYLYHYHSFYFYHYLYSYLYHFILAIYSLPFILIINNIYI